jgi:protein gp37
MIKERSDLEFLFITKRIDRLEECLPEDWGDGYENVHIGCTVENQERADYRLPFFKAAPVRKKSIICEPLLERIDISPYLGPWVLEVIAGGESGDRARPCNYDWVLSLRKQCVASGVAFYFKQTGANFVKDGKIYRVKRQYQHSQARKAGINYLPKGG